MGSLALLGLVQMFKTPEKYEQQQPHPMAAINSSSTPSTNTNFDLNSMPVSARLASRVTGNLGLIA